MDNYTYKTNDLFKPGEPMYLNACVGRNGGPYTFHAYSLGYFDAARVLLQAAINNQMNIDLAVYPITYNYRHGIELGLKHLANLLPQIWGETIPQIRPTHKLIDVWAIVQPFLKREPAFDEDGTRIPYVDGVLVDIVQFDSDAEVFRFPTDRGGGFYLLDSAHINLLVLGNTLEAVRNIFEDWLIVGSALLDWKREDESAAA